jgi:hypothetical protein
MELFPLTIFLGMRKCTSIIQIHLRHDTHLVCLHLEQRFINVCWILLFITVDFYHVRAIEIHHWLLLINII